MVANVKKGTKDAKSRASRGPLKAEHNVGVALGADEPQPFLVRGPKGWTALVGTEADAVQYAASDAMRVALEAVWAEIAEKWAAKQKLPLTEATRNKVKRALQKANKRVPKLRTEVA